MVEHVEAAFVLDLEVERRHVAQQLDNLQVVLADGVVQSCVSVHVLRRGRGNHRQAARTVVVAAGSLVDAEIVAGWVDHKCGCGLSIKIGRMDTQDTGLYKQTGLRVNINSY